MNRKAWANRFGAVAAVGLLVAACNPAVPVRTVTAARRSLVVPILADGSLEPPAGGEIRAAEPGVVGQIFVHEGQPVTRGAAVVRLDSPDLQQRALASRAESAQLHEEEQRSAIELEGAKRERDRLQAIAVADARLVKAGAMTAEQKAVSDANYEQSVAKVRAAELHVSEVANRRRIALENTRELERRANLLLLRAPADGVVYNLPRGAGENVMPGQLVATITDPRLIRVRARVEAPDLPRVRVGQRLVVTFDGLPNQKWDGSVVLVPPGLREVHAREVGEVLGQITGDARALPANASVNVEILVGEKPSALVIPRSALLREGETRYVYKLVAGKAQRTVVTVGLIGPTDVEITSGLREGDRVILPGASVIHDGETVHAP